MLWLSTLQASARHAGATGVAIDKIQQKYSLSSADDR